MCCFNMPFSIALMFILFNPLLDDDDNDESRMMYYAKLMTFCVWLLVLIPIDLVLLPFNFLYASILICFDMDHDRDNWYVYIIKNSCE